MERIIKELSEKYNLPKVAIKAIIESPFKFMAESMRNSENKNFAFIYLGKFVVNQIRLQKRTEALQRKKDEQVKADLGGLEELSNQG